MALNNKMENVQKIGHLELIQWWYLCPSFYGILPTCDYRNLFLA
jgi:hypothetical protein